jgi:hypothetical protein
VVFYNTIVAQAQKIEVEQDRVVFTFSAAQRAIRETFDQQRTWLEGLASQVAGRKIAVASAQNAPAPSGAPAADKADPVKDKKAALREEAMKDQGVQALLEVFPAEIRDVEEM